MQISFAGLHRMRSAGEAGGDVMSRGSKMTAADRARGRGKLVAAGVSKAWSRPVGELQKILGAFHEMRRRPTSYRWPHIGLRLTGGHSPVISEAQVPILGAASCWRFLTSLPEPLFSPGRLLEPGGTLTCSSLKPKNDRVPCLPPTCPHQTSSTSPLSHCRVMHRMAQRGSSCSSRPLMPISFTCRSE